MPPKTPEPPSGEITPEVVFAARRKFLKESAFTVATAAVVGGGLLKLSGSLRTPSKGRAAAPSLSVAPSTSAPSPYNARDDRDPKTPFEDVTGYNNFYELGTDKADPAENGHRIKTRPWQVTIEGACNKPGVFGIDDILKRFALEERVYRMRCVEAWSMVIPWLGFPLAALIRAVEPTSQAKYVAFETLVDPEQMPGQKSGSLAWPYVEGLRMDEAMHPLTLLSVGLYGKALLGQNGAPIRLVVPWKYGFKGIKSIVKIRLQETRPATTWNLAAAGEYGFFANVNPQVSHPRWSQASERRIGESSRRDTLPFNGYADEVASLYTGQDLTRDY